jgi:peptidoglycan/xylan/chitin deacetylase (PgdA/CDA1 family)
MFLRGPRDRRRVALTFDDGPHEMTPKYLEVLARYGAKATFFVIGRACVERPDDLRAIHAAGHEVASHGFTHTEFPRLDRAALRDELERTASLLRPPARGRALVRPPRGVVTPRSLFACFRAGYTSAMWSLDTLDWDAPTAEEVLRRLPMDTIAPGEIVLMHEGKEPTLSALPTVLERLKGRGFEIVTLTELMGPG